jgi:hypothetical protein
MCLETLEENLVEAVKERLANDLKFHFYAKSNKKSDLSSILTFVFGIVATEVITQALETDESASNILNLNNLIAFKENETGKSLEFYLINKAYKELKIDMAGKTRKHRVSADVS